MLWSVLHVRVNEMMWSELPPMLLVESGLTEAPTFQVAAPKPFSAIMAVPSELAKLLAKALRLMWF